jgi:hypothetical protein
MKMDEHDEELLEQVARGETISDRDVARAKELINLHLMMLEELNSRIDPNTTDSGLRNMMSFIGKPLKPLT